MTPDEVSGLATYYEIQIMMSVGLFTEPKRENTPTVSHLLYMCQEIPNLIKAGKIEKAMRWLGFLQGVFCEKDFYTIDQLRDHNRKKDDTETDTSKS